MNDILKPFKEYFTMNKNGEYSHLKRTMLTVFHVRFVFVLFETLGFCKSVRVVFPDLEGDFYIAVQDFRIGIPGMLIQWFGGYALLKAIAKL